MEANSNAPITPLDLANRQLADWQQLRTTLQDAEQIAYCDLVISNLQQAIAEIK